MGTPDRSVSSATKVIQDIWDVFWEELGAVPPDLVLDFGLLLIVPCADEFWRVWSAGAEAGLLGSYHRSAVLFLLVVRQRRLGEGLLKNMWPVCFAVSVAVMSWMLRLPNIL